MIDAPPVSSLPAGPEHRRLPSLKTNGQVTQEQAKAMFVKNAVVEKKPKGRRPRDSARGIPSETQELAEFLQSRRQQVTVEIAGVTISFSACVHLDVHNGCLALCTWGETATSLHLSAEGTDLLVHLEDGRSFHTLYLGCQVKLGLHGMLIGLNLVNE